uniref:Uncharacterized protein n=1 Tax=Globodera rostochiensis TaxID=31243 RepID=A0A914I917_GLORO
MVPKGKAVILLKGKSKKSFPRFIDRRRQLAGDGQKMANPPPPYWALRSNNIRTSKDSRWTDTFNKSVMQLDGMEQIIMPASLLRLGILAFDVRKGVTGGHFSALFKKHTATNNMAICILVFILLSVAANVSKNELVDVEEPYAELNELRQKLQQMESENHECRAKYAAVRQRTRSARSMSEHADTCNVKLHSWKPAAIRQYALRDVSY